MKFAALADIHGNSFALKAVLQDMDALGIEIAVNLGDLFSGPIDAAGTAQLLAQRNFPTICGNHDRYLLEQAPVAMGPSDRVAFEQLEDEAIRFLQGLPATRTVFEDVFLCHGTPTSDSTYWLERVDTTGLVRHANLAEIRAELTGIDASLILCAHTHIPRSLRLPDGQMIVNPGSVGCPAYDDDSPVYHIMQTGTPNASYAILERHGQTWEVTFRSVRYDATQASEMAARFGRPDWSRSLETGWFET